MTTMLEKMAVAMAVSELRRNGMSDALCEAASDHPETIAVALENYGPQARAALLAIRDLDSGDINDGGLSALVAGKKALYSCNSDPELADARGCFHAMIDAILNEKPEAGGEAA